MTEKTRKIVIASEDSAGLDGEVSMHFGRCPAYVVVEAEGCSLGKANVEENIHFDNHQPGVMPLFIKSLGAEVIIAGGMGPRAIHMFEEMGVEVVTGAIGNVRKVVEAYLDGRLKGIVPCAHDHPESCGHPGEGHHG